MGENREEKKTGNKCCQLDSQLRDLNLNLVCVFFFPNLVFIFILLLLLYTSLTILVQEACLVWEMGIYRLIIEA